MIRKTLHILVKSSDEHVFARLFRDHVDGIHRFIYWRVGDEEQAHDMTADVFMKAWEKWSTFDGKYAKAWLYTIARNLVVDSYRKKSDDRIDELDEITDDHDMELAMDLQLESERLHVCLNALKPKSREVLELRFMAGCSTREAAHILQTTEINVRQLQYRALQELRKQYEK